MGIGKVFFLLLLLMVAYGLVVILLRRLTSINQNLSDLHNQMKTNNQRLSDQVQDLRREQATHDARRVVEENPPKI